MRKWELITDLFGYHNGTMFQELRDKDDRKSILFYICECACKIYPQDWPKHFRLVEEPEFTESDMIEAMQEAWNLKPGYDTLPIIETIRKRKAGRS